MACHRRAQVRMALALWPDPAGKQGARGDGPAGATCAGRPSLTRQDASKTLPLGPVGAAQARTRVSGTGNPFSRNHFAAPGWNGRKVFLSQFAGSVSFAAAVACTIRAFCVITDFTIS